jgi:HlyD family secretion protein
MAVEGTLVAQHELAIGAPTAGSRIEAVLADEGDRVVKGQVLVRLDTAILQAQLRHAQATLQEAAASATSAAAEFRRADGISGTGAVSREQVDQRRTAAQSAAARLAAAQAEAAELQTRIAEADIRAPADGVIAARNAEPGTITEAGGAPLFRLIEGGIVQFDAQLPQDQLQQVTPGQPVTVQIGPFGRQALVKGSVRAIAPTVDPQTRLGIVHITLPPDPNLRIGTFVQGRILLSDTLALSAPRSAILSQGDQSFVYVTQCGHARRRNVQIGATEGGPTDGGPTEAGAVEIRHGLAAGDHVVLAAGAFLYDGQAVREMPTGTAARPENPQQ